MVLKIQIQLAILLNIVKLFQFNFELFQFLQFYYILMALRCYFTSIGLNVIASIPLS